MKTVLPLLSLLMVVGVGFGSWDYADVIGDTMIANAYPSDNFGDNVQVNAPAVQSETSVMRGCLIYEMPDEIPEGCEIIDVTWSVYIDFSWNFSYHYFWGHPFLEDWDEMVITWYTQAEYDSEIVMMNEYTPNQEYQWHYFPFTAEGIEVVEEWIEGERDNFGLIVVGEDEEDPAYGMTIASKEYGEEDRASYLLITYANIGLQPSSLGKMKALYR